VLNVPLLNKLPHSRRIGSVEEVARSIDLMPTLLPLADPAGTYEGRDLLAPESPPRDRQPALAELITDQYGPFKMYSVQNSEFRMVETHVLEQQQFDPPRLDFYDLDSSDLVQDGVTPPKGVRTALEGALAKYHRELRPIPTQRVKRQASEERQLLEQLRALGYVE
jgi:arylsulfatase A-like enzyme